MSTERILVAVLAVLMALESVAASAVAQARDADAALSFEELWEEAKHWARETNTIPEDCVFSLHFDPRTARLRQGHSVTCDEPYRSPFYPWPAPSRVGVRFTPEDIRRYGREFTAEWRHLGRHGVVGEDELLETCGIVVGFTHDGRGAAGIECYWQQGSVLGQRSNTGFVVETAGGKRVTSRLYDRINHLRAREMRPMRKRLAEQKVAQEARDGGDEVVVKVEGKVIGRETNRVTIWGRALALLGESSTRFGVVTADARIVVQYPSDDALRPGYYFGGQHCFKEKRVMANAPAAMPEWVYGPCRLRADQYWMFEAYPPGRKTLAHGPYRDYGPCDRERKTIKASRLWVSGHCVRKAKVGFRMIKDGTLVVPSDAPSVE